MLKLADIFEAITGTRPRNAGMIITEAHIDSRQVSIGSMFIALPHNSKDGHNYVGDAFHHGAQVALVERDLSHLFPVIDLRQGFPAEVTSIPVVPFCLRVENTKNALMQIASFWRSKLDLRAIAILGDTGISTVKELVTDVLNQRYCTLRPNPALPINLSMPLSILRFSRGHERVILELDRATPAEITFLFDLFKPQVGVVASSNPRVYRHASTPAAASDARSRLMQAIPSLPEGCVVLNYDQESIRQLASETRARTFYYGLNSQSDVWADGIESLGMEGMRFRLHYRNEVIYLRVPVIGHHSVHSALCAAAVGLVEGLTWHDIASGLRLNRSQLRLLPLNTPGGALILDDTYSASLTSTLAALNMLQGLEGRKVAVIGDMQDPEANERQDYELIGVRAAEVVQELVAVGDSSQVIARAALQAGLSNKAVTWVKNSQEALSYLYSHLKKGDLVLVKGAGSKAMQHIVSSLESYS